MEFFAYCPFCEEKVGSVTTILGGVALESALENDADIEVVHIGGSSSQQGDHKWRLNREEKARLKKWLVEAAVLKKSATPHS